MAIFYVAFCMFTRPGTSYLLPICSRASQVFHAALPREDLHLGHAAQTALPGRRSGVSVSVHRKCIRKRIMIVDRILCEYIYHYICELIVMNINEYNNDIFVLIHHYSEHIYILYVCQFVTYTCVQSMYQFMQIIQPYIM